MRICLMLLDGFWRTPVLWFFLLSSANFRFMILAILVFFSSSLLALG
jgi:hypothetical protein